VRAWDKSLDEKIISELEHGGKTHFYHLWKILQASRNTLNKHLKKLEDQEVIAKDDNPKIGKKRYIRLTDKAILRKSLHILEQVQPRNVTMRHRKLILLILEMIGNSYVGHVRNDGSLMAESLMKGNLPPGSLTSDFMPDFPGITVGAVVNKDFYTTIVEDNEFSYEEITGIIHKLDEAKVISPLFLTSGEERQVFDTEFQKLYWLLKHCFGILDNLLCNMQDKWILLKKKPTSEELNWFVTIVGKRKMNSFFTRLKEERKHIPELHKQSYLEFFPHADANELKNALDKARLTDLRIIKERDLLIKEGVKDLNEKYKELGIKYPVFYELMKETVCPPFIERKQRKGG
jgi:DNA-binding HxlR family transcriptional regulator